MLQTEDQIEAFFYKAVQRYDFGKAIRGKVYRFEQRPDNATGEDMVVHCLNADAEKQQGGTIIINVYVSDITSGGKQMSDKKRIDELAHLAERFTWDFDCADGYSIKLERMPYKNRIEGINQTILTTRIHFTRMAS